MTTSTTLDTAAAQKLRRQRVYNSITIYLACWLLMAGFTALGLVPAYWLMLALMALCASAINAGFLFWIHSGRNLRQTDPSMTAAQMVLATTWAFVPVYVYRDLRAEMLMVYICIFFFGVFRLTRSQFFRIGCCSLALYAGIVLIEQKWLGLGDLTAELIRLGLFAFVLTTIGWIGGHAYQMRQILRAKQRELQRANDIITRQATYDALTGLFNRRALMDALNRQDAFVRRHGGCYSLILIDLDHFKRINDEHGHQAGDAVLQQAAEEVLKNLRSEDLVGHGDLAQAGHVSELAARYGGEEFVIVLPQTHAEGARIVAERLRINIAALRFSESIGPITISASFGVACYRPDEACESVLARADAALYDAKRAGRNQVRCAG